MPTRSAQREEVVRLLNDPELFPDEFKSWLRSYLNNHPDIIWERSQIPSLSGSKLILNTSSSPPASAIAGDLWVYQGSGFFWLFVYDPSEATYKWKFVGGPPVTAEVATGQTTTSTTYAALTTAGPSIALPRDGDYIVKIGCKMKNGATGAFCYMSYDIGGTGAVDADAVFIQTASTTNWHTVMSERKKTGLTAVTLTAKYKDPSATTATFQDRFMSVLPVRVS